MLALVLRLGLLHDDADHEFDYTAGAEQALERADTNAWTTISIKARPGCAMGSGQVRGTLSSSP